MAKYALEDMNNQIICLHRTISQLSATCNNKRNEMAYLQFGVQVLEEHVNGLNSQQEIENETYIYRVIRSLLLKGYKLHKGILGPLRILFCFC